MALPKIPKAGSRQRQVLVHLLNEWTGLWVISTSNIDHDDMVSCVAKLRKKGWPIEDAKPADGVYHSPHGYRIDPERWRSMKGKFEDEFWLS